MKKTLMLVVAGAMSATAFGANISGVAFASPTKGTVGGGEDKGYTITIDPSSLTKLTLSENDKFNRDYSGWYAGVTISWVQETWKSSWTDMKVSDNIANGFAASTTDGLTSHLDEKLAPAGGGVSIEFDTLGWLIKYNYMRTATWWVMLTPQKIARLKGADYEATLVFTTGESRISFKMVIPTEGLDLGTESIAQTSASPSAQSMDYDAKEHVLPAPTVRCGACWTLKEGVDYTLGGETRARGSGASDCTYKAEILPAEGSAFTGVKTVTWSIRAPSPDRSFESVAVSDSRVHGALGKEKDGSGWRLKLDAGTDWVYFPATATPDGSGIAGWYAGIKVALLNDNWQFTAPQYLVFSADGDQTFFNGLDAAKLKAAGVAPEIKDVVITDYDRTQGFAWWTRLTVEDVKQAKAAGEKTLIRTLSATGLRWASEETFSGVLIKDPEGFREQVLTIEANLQGIELYDDKGQKVYPTDLPSPAEVTTDEAVRDALSDASESLRAQIRTVDEYGDFYAWLTSSKLDYQDVKMNENTFFSFATAQTKIVDASALTDANLHLEQVAMEPIETETGDTTLFTFAVSIDGVSVGIAAQSKYLMRVFGAAGAFSMDSPASFSLANAAFLADDEDSAILPFLWMGYVYFSVMPYDGQQAFAPERFFVKPTISPAGRTEHNPLFQIGY